MSLLSEPIILLLTIIVFGELIGLVEYRHFSLGSSAIIFVAVAFGAMGYTLPSDLQTLGLVFFIYSIGLQAGPGFVSSFKKNGLRMSLGAILVVFMGFLTTIIVSLIFGFDGSQAAGIFAGSLTSTPGLAVAAEMTEGTGAAAAYSVTYTFGVVGMVLFIRLIPLFSKIDVRAEEKYEEDIIRSSKSPVTFMHIEVTNSNLFHHRMKDLDIERMGSVNITRLLRKDSHRPELVTSDTVLQKGDRLRVVGSEEDLERVVMYMGKKVRANLDFNSVLDAKRIIISQSRIIGETPESLNIKNVYNAHISRITRNDMDIPVTSHTRFNMGDVLTIVGQKEALDNVAKLLGNDISATYATRAISILSGIFIGFLLGKIPVTIPFVGVLTLGTSGGVLLSGLILGYLKKTGPFLWEIPSTANAFIRELGLFFFLSAVGTSSGSTILHTLQSSGIKLFLSGIIVTLTPLLVVYFAGPFLFRLRFLRLLGVLTGGMTSTPGLAATNSLSSTRFAASAYATVYPVALVAMIVFTRLILNILSFFQS